MFGVAFNPRRPSKGRGCELLTYGIKHLRSWVHDDSGNWRGTTASFGPARVQNVYCAIFVPAQHEGRALGDSCIVTGFPDGSLGMWVPPFPTKAGARYSLRRVYKAHEPGPPVTLIDGTLSYGGVRCLTLCARPSRGAAAPVDATSGYRGSVDTLDAPVNTSGSGDESNAALDLLSGGADGAVRRWKLVQVKQSAATGAPGRGAALACAGCNKVGSCSCKSERIIRLQEPSLPDQGAVYPMVKGLDWHHSQPDNTFVVGTAGCDLWAIAGPKAARTVLDGHSANVHMVAVHPRDPTRFVTADETGTVLKYNTESRLLEHRTVLGFKCYAIAVSSAHLRSGFCACCRCLRRLLVSCALTGRGAAAKAPSLHSASSFYQPTWASMRATVEASSADDHLCKSKS